MKKNPTEAATSSAELSPDSPPAGPTSNPEGQPPTTPPPTDALTEAPAPSPGEPPVDSPAPRPPSVFGALVVDIRTVYRIDVAGVLLDDLHEFEEQFTILVRNKLQLERAHRAGLRGRDLAWRTEIHCREIEVATAKLIELGAFLGPVPDDRQAGDEQRPG